MQKLSGDPTLQALIGNPVRIFDMVPPQPAYPFVTLGDRQDVPDLAECIDGSEVFLTFHIWSRAKTKKSDEASGIAATFDDLLHETELTLDANRCLLIERSAERQLRDPDGLTIHGVITYRALVEPT